MSNRNNYRFKYTLRMKDGSQVEQETNEYYCSVWLAERIINQSFPIYREEIESLTRVELATGETHVFGEKYDLINFHQIIEETEDELDCQLKNIKQVIDLF